MREEITLLINALDSLKQTDIKTTEVRYIIDTLKTVASNMANLVETHDIFKN